MPKYLVEGRWSGYSKGYASYVVEADNEEEAKKIYWKGELRTHFINRDDTEFDPYKVTNLEKE